MTQPRYGSPSEAGRKYRDTAIAGLGLTAASGGVYAYGRGMKQQGRKALEQGMGRSNAGQARLGAVELNNRNTRLDGKPDGRTKAGREIRAAEREIGAGRLQRKAGDRMVRGARLPKRVGLAGLAAGLGLAGAGMVGNEIARSRALRPKANVVPIDRGRELKALRPKSGPAGSRTFVQGDDMKFRQKKTARQEQYDAWVDEKIRAANPWMNEGRG